MSEGWHIVDEDSFERAVAQCGSYEYFDSILAALEYALHRNPEGFPKVDEAKNIYLARTKIQFSGAMVIPAFHLWFRLDLENKTVHKLWLELSAPDDMDIWSDDDSPF